MNFSSACFTTTFFTATLALLLSAFGPALSGPALAQTAGTAGPITFNLFPVDSVDLNLDEGQRLADAARAAQAPGECPLGRITVHTPAGDELFQNATGIARRDAVVAFLDRQGIATSRFPANSVVGGTQNDVQLDYNVPLDDIAPKLATSSQPPKGTKVQPGDLIKVTMIARDDANKFQSGIKAVTLVAESEGNVLIAGPTYPPAPSGCTDVPREREVRGTYTVPADPPPIVRLVATAVDHVGLIDTDIGEFPTGDWYGTFTMISDTKTQTPAIIRMRADLGLNHDGKGNLTGTMVGKHWLIDYTLEGGCSHRTVQPGHFRIALVGSYTQGRSLKVFIKEIEETKRKVLTQCPDHSGYQVDQDFRMAVGNIDAFLGTPSPLGEGEILADGTRQYKFVAEGSGATWTVTLRRARN